MWAADLSLKHTNRKEQKPKKFNCTKQLKMNPFKTHYTTHVVHPHKDTKTHTHTFFCLQSSAQTVCCCLVL